MSINLGPDLDATITAAVNARVEAAVLEALSGDQFIGQMVAKALNAEVEVGGTYSRKKTTFMQATLNSTIQECVKVATAEAIAERKDEIKDAVRAALSDKIELIATSMADNMVEKASSPYGIRVEMQWPSE